MHEQYPIQLIDEKIRQLKSTAEEILAAGGEIEAVRRNALRALASAKMLELDICDVREFLSRV